MQAVEEGAHEMETLDIAVTIVETLNSARQRDNDEDEEDEEDEDDEAPWPPLPQSEPPKVENMLVTVSTAIRQHTAAAAASLKGYYCWPRLCKRRS